MTLTYAHFLLVFLVLPIGLLGWGLRRRLTRRYLAFVGAMALVAVTYTTPWDNLIIAMGVWWYDPELVWGITLGWVPLEEYLFFVLQTALSGLFLLTLLPRDGGRV